MLKIDAKNKTKTIAKAITKSNIKKYYDYDRSKNTQLNIKTMMINKNIKYNISIENYELKITEIESNKIIEPKDLDYLAQNDKSLIKNIFNSMYQNMINSPSSHLYKKSFETDCEIIYVYLLPFLSSNDEYIIKIGYTSNLKNRNLHKEFGLKNENDIYLILGLNITSEKKEQILHNNLKNLPNVVFYPIEKKKQ